MRTSAYLVFLYPFESAKLIRFDLLQKVVDAVPSVLWYNWRWWHSDILSYASS